MISNPLTAVLRNPEQAMGLCPADWTRVIRIARLNDLSGHLYALLDEKQLLETIPERVRRQLESGWIVAENEQRILCWEVNRIGRALRQLAIPIVLLKGAAYLLQKLPNARARISSDVDILVARDQIGAVEGALLKQGWEHIKLEDYDQYYYRKWSHELPPLRHRERGTVVDVHHTILPPSGRLRPDPEKLLAAALPSDGMGFSVLTPVDMVLHSAAHAFQDGDMSRGLRDLVDLDDLLRCFDERPDFWPMLINRAEELELSRPLYYGMRYSMLYLGTPIPESVLNKYQRWRALWPASVIMDRLAALAMIDPTGRWESLLANLARLFLYMRSHWLRMPLYLLFPHLARKALRKLSWWEARS